MSFLHALVAMTQLHAVAGNSRSWMLWEARVTVTVPVGREASTDGDWFKNRANGG